MVKLSHFLQFIYCIACGKFLLKCHLKRVLYISKYKKLLYVAVPPVGRFKNKSDQLALSLLLATAVGFLADYMW